MNVSGSFIPGSTMNRVQTTPERKKAFGLVPARIGAPFKVDGVQMEVRERARHTDAKAKVVCLHKGCAGKTWESLDECAAAHPPLEELVKAEETHVVALFSSDPFKGPPPPPILGLPPEGQPPKQKQIVGLLSDVR